MCSVFLSDSCKASADCCDDAVEELQIERGRRPGTLSSNRSASSVGEGRVVRMDALDGDALRCGVRRLGQRRAPGQMGVVADAAPVHGAQNDRRPRRAGRRPGAQRIIDAAHRLDPAAAQRMTRRRRHIQAESGEMECGHDGAPRQAATGRCVQFNRTTGRSQRSSGQNRPGQDASTLSDSGRAI